VRVYEYIKQNRGFVLRVVCPYRVQNRGFEYGKGWVNSVVRVYENTMQNRPYELCPKIAKTHTGYENSSHLEKNTCTEAILIFIVIDLELHLKHLVPAQKKRRW